MAGTLIAQQESYRLFYDVKAKLVSLAHEGTTVLTAKFHHDTADGASLLSNFSYYFRRRDKNLALLAANMLSDYLKSQRTSKLFCIAGDCEKEFPDSTPEVKDGYRKTDIPRLMLRQHPSKTDSVSANNISLQPMTISASDPDTGDTIQVTIDTLNRATVDAVLRQQINSLLKQTYWGKDNDENYVANALDCSELIIARHQDGQLLGFVRYITDDKSMAYISDMVVDEKWRKQHIGTALMQRLCGTIDANGYPWATLIRAREGDGADAALKLYGDKFGFSEYDHGHQINIYFRYINKSLVLELKDKQTLSTPTVEEATRTGLLFTSQLSPRKESVAQQQCQSTFTAGKK